MADVVTTTKSWNFDFTFQRGGETKTRSFSVTDIADNEDGLAAAKNFRDVMLGSASNPFAAISPTSFFQPTGWRDNDPEELPWDVKSIVLSKVDKSETIYDASYSQTLQRNLVLRDANGVSYGELDTLPSGIGTIYATYDNVNDTDPACLAIQTLGGNSYAGLEQGSSSSADGKTTVPFTIPSSIPSGGNANLYFIVSSEQASGSNVAYEGDAILVRMSRN